MGSQFWINAQGEEVVVVVVQHSIFENNGAKLRLYFFQCSKLTFCNICNILDQCMGGPKSGRDGGCGIQSERTMEPN